MSMRADENFLRTVATLPVGKAFLKAIETMMDAASWHEQQEGKLDQLKVKSGEAASWVLFQTAHADFRVACSDLSLKAILQKDDDVPLKQKAKATAESFMAAYCTKTFDDQNVIVGNFCGGVTDMLDKVKPAILKGTVRVKKDHWQQAKTDALESVGVFAAHVVSVEKCALCFKYGDESKDDKVLISNQDFCV